MPNEQKELFIDVRYRKSFLAKLILAPDETKNYYSMLKNAMLSFSGVRSRVSWFYDCFTIGKVKLAKFCIRGKTLYFYCALMPEAFSGMKVERVTDKKYAEVPCLLRVKNGLRSRVALQLVEALAREWQLTPLKEAGLIDYKLPSEPIDKLLQKQFAEDLTFKNANSNY